MMNFNAKMGRHFLEESELHRLRQLVKEMEDQINYKNKKLTESQLKYEDMCFTLRKLVVDLTMEIDCKNQRLAEMEPKLIQARNAALSFKELTDALRNECIQEMGKTDFFKVQNAKIKHELESQLRELERQVKFLEQRRAKEDIDRKKTSFINHPNLSNSDQDVDALMKRINELEDMEALNLVLIYKERLSNDELQDARKAAMMDMLNSRTTIQIKRMGEINQKPFQEFWKKKYPNNHTHVDDDDDDGEWEEMSAAMCSLWEENVKNPHWQPFKKIKLHGKEEEIIDEDEEKLKELRKEYGQEVYEAVTKALLELNDYNPSGRFTIQELWNVKEGRKASMKDIIQYVIKLLKTLKRKRLH